MKTRRKTKASVKNRREKQKEKNDARKMDAPLKNKIAVNRELLVEAPSYTWPEFVRRGYYLDMPFTCKDCGKKEVWRATQQKWWYEIAKGGLETVAIRCRPCRRKERERKAVVRSEHLEGLKRKHATET